MYKIYPAVELRMKKKVLYVRDQFKIAKYSLQGPMNMITTKIT